LSLAVCLCSCATKEQTYWEKAGKRTIIVHHVRKVNGGLRDHVERLTSTTVRPAEIHVYDLGRMPDGQGGMHEAHEYYRVVQSESFDLRLPPKGKAQVTRGPKTVFTPPNYSPPPKDQRINDAVNEANEARAQLEAARQRMEAELLEVQEEKRRFQEQLDAAMGTLPQGDGSVVPTATAAPTPAVSDLQRWGQQQQ
jgi:hypothetical protein